VSEPDENATPSSARLVVDLSALGRGVAGGLVLIVPISLIVALVNHGRRSGYGGWLFVAFVAILYAYATAGYGAARARPDAPLAHGMLAGLGAFLAWLLVRLAVPLVRGDRLGFGIVAVVTNALFAVALGAAGGLFAGRRGPTALPRD
jgi:hypothetical protein